MGAAENLEVGTPVGNSVDAAVGKIVGAPEGAAEGCTAGKAKGGQGALPGAHLAHDAAVTSSLIFHPAFTSLPSATQIAVAPGVSATPVGPTVPSKVNDPPRMSTSYPASVAKVPSALNIPS